MAEKKPLSELKSSHPHVSSIPGWGSDVGRDMRPGVPKEKAPPIPTGSHWDKPEQQPNPKGVKIYVSVERPRITPVFGTTCPPKGLSGLLKDYAYKQPEELKRRWLALLASDRIDVLESRLGELVSGRASASPTERWLRRALFTGAVVGIGYGIYAYRKRRGPVATTSPRKTSRAKTAARRKSESGRKEKGLKAILTYQMGTDTALPEH
jgi:hypothetical protein